MRASGMQVSMASAWAEAAPFRGEGAADGCMLWAARRNCALSPRQLGLALAVLCIPCVAVAAGFWTQGVRWIAPFAGLELAAVGLAAWAYARHAVDREALLLSDGAIVVEQRCGLQVERIELGPVRDAVRVEQHGGPGALVELHAQGRCARVGRHVRPELRGALAGELSAVLRHARMARV